MHVRRIVALAALLMVPASVSAQDVPMGQIILENLSSQDADLLVDGVYQCGAPAHSSCVADVTSGVHMALIVFADGDTIVSDPIDVPADMAMTLPVRDLTV